MTTGASASAYNFILSTIHRPQAQSRSSTRASAVFETKVLAPYGALLPPFNRRLLKLRRCVGNDGSARSDYDRILAASRPCTTFRTRTPPQYPSPPTRRPTTSTQLQLRQRRGATSSSCACGSGWTRGLRALSPACSGPTATSQYLQQSSRLGTAKLMERCSDGVGDQGAEDVL